MTTYSKITVDSVDASLKAGLMQAQLRQTVTRSLPSARVSNSLKDTIYSDAELGIKATDFDEVRVAWIEVPVGSTTATVQAQLDKFPNAKLRRFLASNIITSDDQESVAKTGLSGAALESFNTKYGIAAGSEWSAEHLKFFLNAIAERQVVRYGEGNTDGKSADAIVPYSGKAQYRRIEFSKDGEEDVDMRIAQEVNTMKNLELAPTANAKVTIPAEV